MNKEKNPFPVFVMMDERDNLRALVKKLKATLQSNKKVDTKVTNCMLAIEKAGF
jgi:hypothetical protein